MISLEDFLTNLEKYLQSVNREISRAPAGRLTWARSKGKVVFFQETFENGARKRKSLNKSPDVLRALARKEFLQIEREAVLANIAALEKIKKQYQQLAPEIVIKQIREPYRLLPEEYFLEPLPAEEERGLADAWANAPFEQSGYMPEKKRHITSRGLRVRSKSELVIAETLYGLGAAFRYEEVVYIGSRRFAPDFTIMREDGSIVYWEHCGMPDNPSYMAAHREKLRNYEAAGIVPWRNLIVTYDEPDGTLNIEIIDSEIRNKIKRR